MADGSGSAVVTGASGGIGLEMARILAARGYDLVLVSRSPERLEAAAEALRQEHGVGARVCAVDLAEPGSARRVSDYTRDQGIDADVLINNAGVGLYGEHIDLELDQIDRMLQLNIAALCDLCWQYGQQMKRRGRGRILNVASTAAYAPTPFFAAYGASKAFVLHFSEALAMELRGTGVTVSCLSPGPTDTGFFATFDAHGLRNRQFGKVDRADARHVAAVGIDLMMRGKLSRVVGLRNYLLACSARFAPRAMAVRVAEMLLRPRGGGGPSSG